MGHHDALRTTAAIVTDSIDFGNPVFLGAAGTITVAVIGLIGVLVKVRPENTKAIVSAASELVTAQGDYSDRLEAEMVRLRAGGDASALQLDELREKLTAATENLRRIQHQHELDLAELRAQLADRDARIVELLQQVADLQAELDTADRKDTRR